MNLDDLKNFDINNLDVNNIGSWSGPIKGIVLLLAFSAVIAGGYYYLITDRLKDLDKYAKQELDLKQEFSRKQAKAANLEAYRAQLEEMRRSFGAMLRQLPGKTEIDALLIDISQAGLAAGLEQDVFQPTGENAKEFYAEVPIKIKLTGTYHQFGEFASSVAALPRIVTLHDIKIQRVGKSSDSEKLTMDVVAKTYRYIEDEQGGGK